MNACTYELLVAPAVGGRRRLAAWLLLGLLVIAHGCHGDKDNELFARLRAAGGAASVLSRPR
jgi:hypothetical protein